MQRGGEEVLAKGAVFSAAILKEKPFQSKNKTKQKADS